MFFKRWRLGAWLAAMLGIARLAGTTQTLPIESASLEGETVTAVALNPNGQFAGVGTSGGKVYAIDLWNDQTYALGAHGSEVDYVGFTSDYGKMVSASYGSDHTVDFWNMSTGALIGSVTDAASQLGSVTLSPDTKYLLGVTLNGKGYYWKVKDRSLANSSPWTLFSPVNTITAVAAAFNSDGDRFFLGVSGGNSGTYGEGYYYDPSFGGRYNTSVYYYPIYTHASGDSEVRSVAITPNNKYVFTAGDQTMIWNYNSPYYNSQIAEEADQIFSNSDGSKLYLTDNSDGGKLAGWTRDGGSLGGYVFSGSIAAATSTDLSQFVIGSGNTVEVWPTKGIRLGTVPNVTLDTATTITWSTLDYSGSANLALYRGGLWMRDIASGIKTSLGKYAWKPSGIAGGDYTIRLTTTDGAYQTDSASFSIYTLGSSKYLSVQDPSSEVTWTVGETHRISWYQMNLSDAANVKLYWKNVWVKNLSNYVPAGQNYFDWKVDANAGDYHIQVNNDGNGAINDFSAVVHVAPTPAPENAARKWTEYR